MDSSVSAKVWNLVLRVPSRFKRAIQRDGPALVACAQRGPLRNRLRRFFSRARHVDAPARHIQTEAAQFTARARGVFVLFCSVAALVSALSSLMYCCNKI